MSQAFFERMTRAGWLTAFFVAVAAAPFLGLRWAAAVGIGFAWIYLNFFFLICLLVGKRIALFAALKFPVIYLTGFFVLKSRYFPTSGILSGLTVFFAVLVVVYLTDLRSKSAQSVAA